MTATQEGLLTTRQVAALVGCTPEHVSRLAQRGVLPGRRGPTGRWLFDRAEVLACWERRLEPVERVEPTLFLPAYRYVAADRRPHVELLEAVGLSDEEIAAELGVELRKVRRWHEHGVASPCVARLRALAARVGGGG